MRKIFALFFVATLISHSAFADELTPAKRADIRALLQVSGGANLPKQFGALASRDVIQRIRGVPGYTAKIGQSVQDEMINIFTEGMTPAGALGEKIEEVYAKYYTHQEIKELTTFFRSSVGQKFVGASIDVSRDLVGAGLSWGASVAPAVNARLKTRLQKEGFELPTPNAGQGKAPPAQPATKSAPAK